MQPLILHCRMFSMLDVEELITIHCAYFLGFTFGQPFFFFFCRLLSSARLLRSMRSARGLSSCTLICCSSFGHQGQVLSPILVLRHPPWCIWEDRVMDDSIDPSALSFCTICVSVSAAVSLSLIHILYVLFVRVHVGDEQIEP